MSTYPIEAPQFMGMTGDDCASCNSTTGSLYAVSCHQSDDFHCRDCLTKSWYKAKDDVVRCPHQPCRQVCGFKPLQPLTQGLHLDNGFYDAERIDRIRQQPGVMNSMIAFTAEEAEIILHHIITMFMDQIMDTSALGGQLGINSSFQASLDVNPFVISFLREMTQVPKMLIRPSDLDEDLLTLLSNTLFAYAQVHYGSEMMRRGIDMRDQETVLSTACDQYKHFNEIKENWEEIIKKWVELLTWRHLERLAPPEGGAAERQDSIF